MITESVSLDILCTILLLLVQEHLPLTSLISLFFFLFLSLLYAPISLLAPPALSPVAARSHHHLACECVAFGVKSKRGKSQIYRSEGPASTPKDPFSIPNVHKKFQKLTRNISKVIASFRNSLNLDSPPSSKAHASSRKLA
ncbi:hypothetical protein VIGAN_03213000 [Vigna angularis var. angularis]|uniref:Uncharacterized protein n=1 Tax=Vigna angularis var. angularis TaxID=157739 RepID=A0A0S3RNK1_PHAAN|nr:hypothetical protein VIGAN_03213000 [Vigna angularis var. angularis]